MPDSPVFLKKLHVSILMRIYLLGGKSVSLEQIIDEAQAKYCRSEVLAAIADMKGVLVDLTASRLSKITLVGEGYFHARAPLDVIALTRPSLFSANTPLLGFLEYYDQCDIEGSAAPSKRAQLRLQIKWLFRRNWKPV